MNHNNDPKQSTTSIPSYTQSAKKAVLTNALPAMAAMVLVLVYNMADLFFIGQTGDPLQVAAIALATPVFMIFMSIGNIFGIGGSSLLSRSIGRGDTALAKKISSFCFWSCIVIGVTLSTVMLLAMDGLVALLGASPDIAPMVSNYLKVICLSGVLILISSCFSALVRGEGKPQKAMTGMMIGNLVNIVLDPIFILTLEMGVEGAAIATLIGNTCGGLYYLLYLWKGDTLLSFAPKQFTTSQGIMKEVLFIGIPASLSTILMSVAQIVLNGQMTQYGDLAVAGIGVAMKVIMLSGMVCIGLGMGVQPLLGFAIGAQDEKRYQEVFRFSLAFALTLGCVLTSACYLALEPIVGAFLTDQDAFSYAYSFSQILLSTSFFFGVLFVLSNALQAAGAATESLIINVSRQGLIYIPMVFIMGALFGASGLVMAQPIADIMALIMAIFLYRRQYKRLFAQVEATPEISKRAA